MKNLWNLISIIAFAFVLTACSDGKPDPITVSLANDNPAAGAVVAGQATADLAHFAFSGTGTITSVKLKRIGISSNSTLTNVYLYNGNVRVADGVAVSNTDSTITFNNLSIASPVTLSVKADIATDGAGQIVGVQLVGYTVLGSTTVTSANISGNFMSVAAWAGVEGCTSNDGFSTTTGESCSVMPICPANTVLGSGGYSTGASQLGIYKLTASCNSNGKFTVDVLENISTGGGNFRTFTSDESAHMWTTRVNSPTYWMECSETMCTIDKSAVESDIRFTFAIPVAQEAL